MSKRTADVVVDDYSRVCASYGRISKRVAGDGGGATIKIERQHDENSTYLAEYHPGVEVVTYDDNMSGWSPDVVRPGFDAFVDDIRAGKFKAIVAWHADRLTRQPLQLELLWDACQRSKTEFHTKRGGLVRDPLALRIEGALAARESDGKSDRISARIDTLAHEGKWTGGRRRFGYEKGMTAIRESEATIVREIAARVIKGESLNSIALDLARREIETPEGGKWRGPNVGLLIRRPHLAALRVHQGQVVGDAQWDAILDRATHEQILSLLGDPSRRTTTTSGRRWLLSGVATCGECGEIVRGRPVYKRVNGKTTKDVLSRGYACATGKHVHRNMLDVDAVVEGAIVARLERTDVAGLFADDSAAEDAAHLRAQIAALDVREDENATERATGQLSASAYAKATTAIANERKRLHDELNAIVAANARPRAALKGVTGEGVDVAAVWAAADLNHKRAIIDALCTVTINKAPRRGAEFDAEQAVTITWKGSDD